MCHIQNEQVVYLTSQVCPSGNFRQAPHLMSNILEMRKEYGSHYSLDWTAGLHYWTGLPDSPKTVQNYFPCSVGENLIMFIQPASLLNLLPYPVESTLIESVEVKGHMDI